MKYFELYGIPVSFRPDAATVKNKFQELSRKYNQEIRTGTNYESRAEALQKSGDVNIAYSIFSNPDKTTRYILKEKGLMDDEEKYALHASFLGEVMDVNEQLMELEMHNDEVGLKECEAEVNNLLNKIYEDVAVDMENYKEGFSTQEELLRIKDYYYSKKYLLRILDKIAQMRNIATP